MFKSLLALLFLLAPITLLAQPIVIKDYPADKISPSVYVLHGPTAIPNEVNQGFMNNPGIVMTTKGVVVIDPGGTIESGEMVLRVIKKLTNKPVVAIFNTHIHADHWFGNAAIIKAYPNIPIYGHQMTIDEAPTVGESWVGIVKSLTKNDGIKTAVIGANKAVKHGDVINIGNTSFTIYHYGVAHTHSDIMIAINGGEVVFMGDNLFNGRLNQHTEGHIKKTWESVEKAVAVSKAQVIVPGHGKSGGKDMLKHSLDVHKLLYQSVQAQFEDDKSDFEMRPAVEAVLADYSLWDQYALILGKAINKAFLEIEEADFQ